MEIKTCETCSQATSCTTSALHSEICRDSGFRYWTPSKLYERCEAAERVVKDARIMREAMRGVEIQGKYKKAIDALTAIDNFDKSFVAYDKVVAGDDDG